jgi:hypothetical protein
MASNPHHQVPISEMLCQARWRVVAGSWLLPSARGIAWPALLSLNCAAVIGCPGRRWRQSSHTVCTAGCRSEDATRVCVANRISAHWRRWKKTILRSRVCYLALPISLYFSVRGRSRNPPALDPRALSWRSSRAANHASARSHIMKMRIVLRIERMARAKSVLLSVWFTLLNPGLTRGELLVPMERNPSVAQQPTSRGPAQLDRLLFFCPRAVVLTMNHEPRKSGVCLIQPSALSVLRNLNWPSFA